MEQPPFEGDRATEPAPSVAEELPWTGERLVPSQTGQIAAEHLHRYAIACALAQGKDVLDIASGEGYGGALLGRTARSVVGVDIDSESVRHATRKYGSRRVRFLRGDCRAIPLADASVDLVVSFETIEHIQQHDDFLNEVRRVLRKGGLFIASTPDKQNYGDSRDTDNPFHVRELSFAEFRDALTARFKHVRFLGQRYASVSVVLGDASVKPLTLEMFTGNFQGREASRALVAPTYLLAVCSDRPLPSVPEGVFEFKDAVAHLEPQPELYAQLFGGDGDGYSETRSIKKAVVAGAWQTVRFEHVERVHRDGRSRLRIDPANAAAFVELASLRVIRDADSSVAYTAQSAAEFATAEFAGNLLAHVEDGRLLLLARDADPQIYLPPLGDFHGRSSYTLELTFRLETRLAGVVQRHHDLLTRHRELAETAEVWGRRAAQLGSAEAAWKQSHADLRVALESSRMDSGRLESQLALATSDATIVHRELQALRESLSWRLTLPLRSVQRFLARQRRSLG